MSDNLLNLPLLLQILQRRSSEAAIDLEAIDERGDGDEAVGLHVFVEFVRGGFVEDDGVVGFVLDCSLDVSWFVTFESTLGPGGGEKGGKGDSMLGCMGWDVPLPFDHFFFCFLPAAAAAGAWVMSVSVPGSPFLGKERALLP